MNSTNGYRRMNKITATWTRDGHTVLVGLPEPGPLDRFGKTRWFRSISIDGERVGESRGADLLRAKCLAADYLFRAIAKDRNG